MLRIENSFAFSLIKIKVEHFKLLHILLLHALPHAANIAGQTVVDRAVVECEVDVVHEPLHILVLVILNFPFNCAEVHRALNYCVVILQSECLSIYGGCE